MVHLPEKVIEFRQSYGGVDIADPHHVLCPLALPKAVLLL